MYLNKYHLKIDKDVYQISYPNVGQQLEIENLKNILSGGQYSTWTRSVNKTAVQLLDLIDAVSYFTVLIPELKNKIDLRNFASIDPLYQRKLSRAFLKFNAEFIVPCEEEMNKELTEEDADEVKA